MVTLASNLLPPMPPTEQEKAASAASAATSAAAAAAAAAAGGRTASAPSLADTLCGGHQFASKRAEDAEAIFLIISGISVVTGYEESASSVFLHHGHCPSRTLRGDVNIWEMPA